MVIAELKQKYSNLKAGTSSTDDTIPKAVATSSNDIKTNDGLATNQNVTNDKSKKVAKNVKKRGKKKVIPNHTILNFTYKMLFSNKCYLQECLLGPDHL